MLANAPVRIVVIDDHDLIRTTVEDRLAREPGLEVVGSTSDLQEAQRLIIEHDPQLVLLDVDLAGTISLDFARQLRAERPDLRLIFVSGFVYDRYIQQALDIKAAGYVSKNEGIDALIGVIRRIIAGERYFSPEVTQRLVVERQHTRDVRVTNSNTRGASLTSREAEILRDIARGFSKREIADQLQISVKTIESHCDNLMTKLNIHDRVGLARFAIREGLADA